jgi:hypothetical protein
MNQKILCRYLEQKDYFYQVANNGIEVTQKIREKETTAG